MTEFDVIFIIDIDIDIYYRKQNTLSILINLNAYQIGSGEALILYWKLNMVETEEEEKPPVSVMSQQQEKIYPELMTESSASFDQPSSNNTKEDNKSKTKVEIKGILTVIGGFIVCLSFGSGKI